MADSKSDLFPAPETGRPRDAAVTERWRGLFADLAEGRTAALGELYAASADELYGLALWRTGSPTDAADVVQEVFVRLARLRDRLRTIRDPMAYLRRMTHRESVDVHRRRSRRREEPLQDCPFVEPYEPSP